jgi:hypothetical protein
MILNKAQIVNKAQYLKSVLNDQKFTVNNLPSDNIIVLNKNYMEE